MTTIVLDPGAADPTPFPRIHEGRYEVDPWATGLRSPLPTDLSSAVKRAGIRFLRVGVGCWLPSQDPDPSNHADREWFTGATLEDTRDPSQFNFTHLDRNLEVCRELGLDLLLCFDYMPRTLARPGNPKRVPLRIRPFAPKGYEFPDGIRDAPTDRPEIFAAAALTLLRHVEASGVTIRYVELWNEPDLPFFYAGTYSEYLPMYAAFARAVHDAGYRVGGPSWAGALEPENWLAAFLRDCREQRIPLDFYSFHRYDHDVDKVIERCRQIRQALDDNGFSGTEAVLDEWGPDLRDAAFFGTVGNAAFTASCLMQFPDVGIAAQTEVLLVDPVAADDLRFHGLVRRDGDPNPITLCLEAFEEFQQTPYRIRTDADDVVLAGIDADARQLRVILTNPDTKNVRNFELSSSSPGNGTVRHLTPASFGSGGWAGPEPVDLVAPVRIALEPQTMATLTFLLSG